MLTLKQLKYALAVEKHLHFNKAAESCFVSQSALSTALHALEQHLGVQIFERDNKKVLVTPLGKEVLKKAKEICLLTEDLDHLAEHYQHTLSFPMSIGFIPTISPYLLPKILPRLNNDFPRFTLNVVEEQSHVLVDMVRNGDIDSAVLALPYPCEGLLSFEFWQEDFFWIAHKDETHATRREITSHEIEPSRLMLLKDGHCLKEHALEACKLPQQSANHGFGATSLNTLIQMVIGKMGTTLVPQMALEQLTQPHSQLRVAHLSEPGPHRRLAFVVRPNFSRLSSIEALIEVCQTALNAEL